VAQSAGSVDSFAVDGSFVYWGTGSGQVLRAPTTGGTPQPLASDLNEPVVHGVDDAYVYVQDQRTILALPK
jgi:hypothetical protein